MLTERQLEKPPLVTVPMGGGAYEYDPNEPDTETVFPSMGPTAISIGFTHDLFSGVFHRKRKIINCLLFNSLQEGRGNSRRLISKMLELGFTVKIHVPSVAMDRIVRKYGFTHSIEDNYDVWTKTPEIRNLEIIRNDERWNRFKKRKKTPSA